MFEAVLFKLLIISSGCFFGWLGFRMFQNGLVIGGGEIGGSARGTHVQFRNVAPGLFFMFVGGAIILTTAYKGLVIVHKPASPPGDQITEPKPATDPPGETHIFAYGGKHR